MVVNETVDDETSGGTLPEMNGETTSGMAATPSYVVRRWTLGGFLVQVLLLALVATIGFGGGYFTKDRQEMVAFQTLLEQQLASQDQIVTLERQLLTLEQARAEDQRGRATVVEVDLEQVLGQLRDGVAHSARARIDALAADLTADVARLGQITLRDRIEATGTSTMIEPEAVDPAPSPALFGPVSELLASKPSLTDLEGR